MYPVAMVWYGNTYPLYVIHDAVDGSEPVFELLSIEGDEEKRWFDLPGATWADFVKLGLMFGWEPEGALLQRRFGCHPYGTYPEETGVETYDPGDCAYPKIILKSDAAAWADALERALTQLTAGMLDFTFEQGPLLIREFMTPEEFSRANSPTTLQRMSEFIVWLRMGGFKFSYDD